MKIDFLKNILKSIIDRKFVLVSDIYLYIIRIGQFDFFLNNTYIFQYLCIRNINYLDENRFHKKKKKTDNW